MNCEKFPFRKDAAHTPELQNHHSCRVFHEGIVYKNINDIEF